MDIIHYMTRIILINQHYTKKSYQKDRVQTKEERTRAQTSNKEDAEKYMEEGRHSSIEI